jgi:AcrR family transcriptional regulator
MVTEATVPASIESRFVEYRSLEAIAAEVASHPHGRVPRQLREAHILALAEELFVEKGFQAASMDELARRAGVSKPVIYELVGSKDDVFRICIERSAADLARRVMTAVMGELQPAARLRAGGIAFFQFVAEHRRAWSVLLSGGATPFAAELIGIVRRNQASLVAILLAEAAAAEGIRISPPQAEALAHALNGAFEALANWWIDHPELTPETLASWLTDVIEPGIARLARREDETPPPA